MGRKRFLLLVPMSAAERPVTTLLLTAPDQHALDELEAVATAAVRVLSNVIHCGSSDAWTLRGAGHTESYIASQLRLPSEVEGREAASSMREVADNFACCLERCVASLLPLDSIAQCMARHATSPTSASVPGFADPAARVLDSFQAKVAALSVAVEIANTVLRVDSAIQW